MISALSVHIQPFFEWLVRTTLQASLLICLILLIQAVLRHRLAARWRYGLWLVLFVRMALPWAPQSHISIFNVLPQSLPFGHEASMSREPRDADAASAVMASGAEGSREGETASAIRTADGIKTVDVQASRTLQMPQKGAAFEFARIADLLPLLWLAGVSILTAYILWSNILLWRIVRSQRPLTDQAILDLLEDCKDQIGARVILAVIATDQVNTPALFGFVRPRLLLPKAMIEELTLDELRYIFLHELAHLKRHDIVVGYVASFLHVLHWFNPVVWFGFRRVRADRELATDALAMSSMKADETPRYGHAIIRQLERFLQARRLPSLAGLCESKAQIKRRMTMIAQNQTNSYRWSVAGVGLITVLGTISMIDPTRAAVSSGPAPQAKSTVTMRLVEQDANVGFYVSVSPDRRYLCGYDTRQVRGEIAIREVATGEEHVIKPTSETPQESVPYYPVMSPDNKTIAYTAWHGREMGWPDRGEVRLIGSDGSGQRVLCPALRLIQWFPDGRRLLGIRLPQGSYKGVEIVSVSVADGSIQTIKMLNVGGGNLFSTTIRLSPDAEYVAYELPSKDAPAKNDIFALDVDSNQETLLVGHPADDRLLDWTPDGRHILFGSDRLGQRSVWLLPVAQGRAQGTPKLVVQSASEMRPIGFAQNGSYFYAVGAYAGDIYTAGINLTTGQLLSPPAPLESGGFNMVADWSPDGKYLAYTSRPAGAPGPASRPGVIRIRTLATGAERELAKPPTSFDCLRWSPDGHSLLVSGMRAYRPEDIVLTRRVYRIDATTGETTLLLEHKLDDYWWVTMAELSPDGKILYYQQGGIIRRELDTGQDKILLPFLDKGPWVGWALSPNGEFIATGINEGTGQKGPEGAPEGGVKKVLLIPSQGGKATELVRWDQEPASYLTHTCWSPDGKTVLFTLHRAPVAGKNAKAIEEFWQVSAEGGEPRKIMETDLHMPRYGFRVHPDGQRIAFSAGAGYGGLWVMENFLPQETGK